MVLQDEEQCKSFFTHAVIPLDSCTTNAKTFVEYATETFLLEVTKDYLHNLCITIIGDILAVIP